jgi:hypothetical protein
LLFGFYLFGSGIGIYLQRQFQKINRGFIFKFQNLTFAVLSQTIGVVTCGERGTRSASPGSYFKNPLSGETVKKEIL